MTTTTVNERLPLAVVGFRGAPGRYRRAPYQTRRQIVIPQRDDHEPTTFRIAIARSLPLSLSQPRALSVRMSAGRYFAAVLTTSTTTPRRRLRRVSPARSCRCCSSSSHLSVAERSLATEALRFCCRPHYRSPLLLSYYSRGVPPRVSLCVSSSGSRPRALAGSLADSQPADSSLRVVLTPTRTRPRRSTECCVYVIAAVLLPVALSLCRRCRVVDLRRWR